MLPLQFKPSDRPLVVLALGAHADDLEIGAAGLLARLAEECEAKIHWAVFSAPGVRRGEAERSATAWCTGAQRHIFEFEESVFPSQVPALKVTLRELGRQVAPDIVLTHRLEDRHQDHRCLAELTWQTFRDQVVLEYEIPKFEGDLGPMNCLVPLSAELLERKLAHLAQAFPTQAVKPWYSEQTFRAIARLRGIECNSPSGFAEAFCARKLTLLPF